MAALPLACLPAPAPASSLGLGLAAGDGQQSQRIDGRLDLDADADWQALGGYARSSTLLTGGPVTAVQYWLGAGHRFSPALDASAELVYGGDSGSSVRFFGPSLRAYYRFWAEHARAGTLNDDAALDREIEEALSGGLSEPGALGAACGLFVGLDAYTYTMSAAGIPHTRVNPAGKTVTASSGGDALRLHQFSPSAGLDIALWRDRLRLSVAGTYCLYGQDPELLAGPVNQLYAPKLDPSRANALVSGLLAHSWQAGLGVQLPSQLDVDASYGRQRLLDSPAWVEIYGARLAKSFWGRLRADLGTSYSVQEGEGQWLLDTGVRFRF